MAALGDAEAGRPAGRRRASALVMCPTRDLALQVAEELTALARHRLLESVLRDFADAPRC